MHPPHQAAGQGGCSHREGRTARASPPLPPVPSALSCKLKGTLCREGAAQVLQSCLSAKAQEPQNKVEGEGVQAPSPRRPPRCLEQRPGWGGSSCEHRALELSSRLSPRHRPARWVLGCSAPLACRWELGSRQVVPLLRASMSRSSRAWPVQMGDCAHWSGLARARGQE